jgi:signal transduction histidine kinase
MPKPSVSILFVECDSPDGDWLGAQSDEDDFHPLSITRARDIDEAIERLAGTRFDLILIDFKNSGNSEKEDDDVMEAIDRLRDEARQTPIVCLSSSNLKTGKMVHESEEHHHEFVEELESIIEKRTEELERRNTQLRLLAEELAQAEDRERKRLAQGIHDDLQQLLVGGKYCAEKLSNSVNLELKETADRLTQFLNEAIESARSLTFELSPPVLRNPGLAQALEYLARRMKEKYGLSVSVRVREPVEPETESISALIFQSVRELLFNIVKHAHVDKAEVELCRSADGCIQVTIADDGLGFTPLDPSLRRDDQTACVSGDIRYGYGLHNIRGRLELLGGNLVIRSSPGNGTRCTLTVPSGESASTAASKHRAVRSTPRNVKPHGGLARAGHRIRVLVFGDCPLMRLGLARILRGFKDISVVGEAADGLELLETTRRVNPEIVLMDMSNAGVEDRETACRLKQEFPRVRIIGISTTEKQSDETAMREAGASAFIDRSGHMESLVTAIRNSIGSVA